MPHTVRLKNCRPIVAQYVATAQKLIELVLYLLVTALPSNEVKEIIINNTS